MRSSVRGFTLLEMMIVVTMIGILAAIAFPSYNSYILRSNRTVGKTVIMRIAGMQENYFNDRKQYATVLGGLSVPASTAATLYVLRDGQTATATSTEAIYSVTLTGATAMAFTIQATPINRQTKDTSCGTLTYTNTGVKTASGSDGANCWKS
jgi:type IV pilus assembly protein PilE